jgi:hypothetical protein
MILITIIHLKLLHFDHFVPDRSSTSTTSIRVGLLGFSLDHQRPDLDRFGSMKSFLFKLLTVNRIISQIVFRQVFR